MSFAADIRTEFSVGESLLTPKHAAELAAGAGYKAAAVVDTMSISSMPDFTKACDEHGIKPVIGVRLHVVDSLEREQKQKAVYPVLYILSDEGFRIVTQLLTTANDEDHFYYKPRLLWADVLRALKGAQDHVAFATGALYSAIRHPRAGDVLGRVKRALGRDNTLVQITPFDSAVWDRQAAVGYELAREHDLPVLVSRPAIFEEDGLWDRLGLMNAIASNAKGRNSFKAWNSAYHPQPAADVLRAAVEQIARIESRFGLIVDRGALRGATKVWADLVGSVSFKWAKLDVSLPKMAEDENAELKVLAAEGFKRRLAEGGTFGVRNADRLEVYVQRLKYELDVLTGMGFSGYFLLVKKIVDFSKENGIVVGPGRGSVGGSLLSYVLGITEVDPIRFDLIFERFINPERIDLPDIDLDFMSARRHEIIEFLIEEYGEDCVANISNFLSLQSKGILQNVARVSGLPPKTLAISKLIPVEQGTPMPLERAVEEIAEIKEFAETYPEEWKLSCYLEGRMRGLAKHAAGVVVAGEPLVNRAAVERRSGEATVNWDKRVVEDMGLIKIDILGLSTLDITHIALKKIAAAGKEVPDLNKIPLDDATVLDNFAKGRTVGIFQFESGGMQKLLRSLALEDDLTFGDLAAANALYRPGPMDSGLMDDFVAIRQGQMSPQYGHTKMRPALEETLGVMVYQEQVMRVSRDLAGFTGPEADHMRKAIGKKDKEKMAAMGEKFIAGAVKSGMPETQAAALWDQIVAFAGYSFNKSHAVEYSLIAYQTMWLKTYFPLEFYAAAMSIVGSEKMTGLLRDAKRAGVDVEPPDVNVSTTEFEIKDDHTLTAPLKALKGLSDKGAGMIVAERDENGPFKSMQDFRDRLPARNVNKTVLGNLDRVGAFAGIEAGQPIPLDPCRRDDQLVLTPDVVLGGALVTRAIPTDRKTKKGIRGALSDPATLSEAPFEGAPFVMPRFGKEPKFMAITDGPGTTEAAKKKFTVGNSFSTMAEQLEIAGLEIDDGYWTGLCKVPKKTGEKMFTMEQIAACAPILRKEIEVLKPPVILVLGSATMRFFEPKMKGGPADHAGRIIYRKESEPGAGDACNIVIGITPGMLYFDPSKSKLLQDALAEVKEMVF